MIVKNDLASKISKSLYVYLLTQCLPFHGLFIHKLKGFQALPTTSQKRGFSSQIHFPKSSKSQVNASTIPQIFADCFKTLERKTSFVFVIKYVQVPS